LRQVECASKVRRPIRSGARFRLEWCVFRLRDIRWVADEEMWSIVSDDRLRLALP
jgi:hypothetical protein